MSLADLLRALIFGKILSRKTGILRPNKFQEQNFLKSRSEDYLLARLVVKNSPAEGLCFRSVCIPSRSPDSTDAGGRCLYVACALHGDLAGVRVKRRPVCSTIYSCLTTFRNFWSCVLVKSWECPHISKESIELEPGDVGRALAAIPPEAFGRIYSRG
jgi:hypothetical protein